MEFEDMLCAYGIGILCGILIATAISCWHERRQKGRKFYLIPLNDSFWRKDNLDQLESAIYAEHQAKKERIQ
jgi:hypothetical protein